MHSGGEDPFGSLGADLSATALALARRFAGGATLWCWAPDAPEHAQHVAVEFVHPVIVGKRSLPAVAVHGDPLAATAQLRPLCRSGDVLIAVGSWSRHREVSPVLLRARSWGVTTIWVGAGERPPVGAADFVLAAEGDGALASYDGRLVLVYHLLWELTHVCFEHPGLLRPDVEGEGPACVTCSDEGRLAEVVSCDTGEVLGRTAAGVETIDTTLVDAVDAGDVVLVHAGMAVTIVDHRR